MANVIDFSSKLNLQKKQVKFIENTYTVNTDFKTGLLINELMDRPNDPDFEVNLLKLAYGENQYEELKKELEENDNYLSNKNAVLYGTMSVLYSRPYDDFEKAVNKQIKNL